jgi:hypothetical protein
MSTTTKKAYDNSDTVSVWEKVSAKGNTYFSGVVYVGNVAYDLTLFPKEATSEKSPVMTGKISMREAK